MTQLTTGLPIISLLSELGFVKTFIAEDHREIVLHDSWSNEVRLSANEVAQLSHECWRIYKMMERETIDPNFYTTGPDYDY